MQEDSGKIFLRASPPVGVALSALGVGLALARLPSTLSLLALLGGVTLMVMPAAAFLGRQVSRLWRRRSG